MIGSKSFRIILLALLVIGLLCGSKTAFADGFSAVTPGNLVKAFIRFGALDIRDDNVIDDYILTNECKIYNYFRQDDFKWHEVQEATRKAIRQNVEVYPTAFDYDSPMQLDRYDFENKIFRFNAGGNRSINTFRINMPDYDMCGKSRLKTISYNVSFVLDRSIQFLGIPLDEAQAKDLLKQIEKDQNVDRIVYARFKIKVIYIQPILKKDAGPWGKESYTQNGTESIARVDARLDAIEFYRDKERTKLIIKYVP